MELEFKNAIGNYIEEMPCLPTSSLMALEVCNNYFTSSGDLVKLVSLDPVIYGRLLFLANSVYPQEEQPIGSSERAIIKLGMNTVKNLIVSMVEHKTNWTSEKDGHINDGLDMINFWRHCLCVGITARLLAQKKGEDLRTAERYFTAGFLHDIGKIPLNGIMKSQYILVLDSAREGQRSLHNEESRSFGFNHCCSGSFINKAWRLDNYIGDAIMYHHSSDDYEGEYRDLVQCIAAANQFASCSGIGFSGTTGADGSSAENMEKLGIKPDLFNDIRNTVLKEMENAEFFLKIDEAAGRGTSCMSG